MIFYVCYFVVNFFEIVKENCQIKNNYFAENMSVYNTKLQTLVLFCSNTFTSFLKARNARMNILRSMPLKRISVHAHGVHVSTLQQVEEEFPRVTNTR